MPWPLMLQFLLCPLVFFCLLKVTAPYGRHFRPGWGPTLPNRLAWLLMELPALVLIVALTLSHPAGRRPVAWVPLLFWGFHYAYRSFLFPLLMKPSHRTFPAQLVLMAIAFNILNGYNNAQGLLASALDDTPLISAHFVGGAILFCAGFVLHVHSDARIRGLRAPGETAYRIPDGGAFRWVGSPHYLGEIIMWSGWAVMTWTLAGLAFALFTICNLAPRALANHRWYRERFADYPSARRILVPGIW